MDSQGKFVKVIKRTASQLENPLCSEEDDEMYDEMQCLNHAAMRPNGQFYHCCLDLRV